MQRPLIDIHTHKTGEDALILHAVRVGSGEKIPCGERISAGIHPWDAERAEENWLDEIRRLRPEAVGEIGLDFATQVDRAKQRTWFIRQLDLAEEMGLPVVIHCVRAYHELLPLLKGRSLPVIVHGFTGSEQLAAQLVRAGLFLSFGETVTASPKTARALKTLPAGRLFLETDRSALGIDRIYALAAAVRECPTDELRETIEQNYRKIFAR